MSVDLGQLNPSQDLRAGRMLVGGRVSVTVTSKKTGDHVTIHFASKAKEDKWKNVLFEDATHVFIKAGRRGWEGDKVGTFYPKTGKLFTDRAADQARVWAAIEALKWMCGAGESDRAEYLEESRCGCCGRELTDPVSIERGIGPECFGKITGARHAARAQAKLAVEDKTPDTGDLPATDQLELIGA